MKSKDKKRDNILEAARKIFSRYGYTKTTLDDIGEVVGIKKNSLYHYFKSKEELFETIIEYEAGLYFDTMQKLVAKEKTATKKIFAAVLDGRKAARQRTNLYQGTVSAKMELVGVIENSFNHFIEKQIQLLKDLLNEGIKNNEFVKHNAEIVAKDIVQMNLAIEQREYQKSKFELLTEIDHNDLDRCQSDLLNLILKGLRKN
ncbi:MAG: TetR/AcrR family transcriptional regulator [Ignavibacteriaceae bacterium]|nr:TetR/AcrR family transcriptional regulator [Ignavibacteriaceae bacterium]